MKRRDEVGGSRVPEPEIFLGILPDFPFSVPSVIFFSFFFWWQIFDLHPSSTGIIKNQKISLHYSVPSPSPHIPHPPVSYLSDKTALSETRNCHESSDSGPWSLTLLSKYVSLIYYIQIIFKLCLYCV